MASTGGVNDTCNCKVCNGVRSRLDKIFTVLEAYGWILETYIVDFFEDNLWMKLPSQWRDILSNASPSELGNWILRKTTSATCKPRVWPLSLLALRQTVECLGIVRDYRTEEIIKCCGSRGNKNENLQPEGKSCRTRKKRIDDKHQKLFTISVKEKKRHEIEKFSEMTSECAALANSECVVDIGAGMGHLARSLAYNYGMCAICLEQDKSLSDQARLHDAKLFEALQKRVPEIQERSPSHVSARISKFDIQGDELLKKLRTQFGGNFKLDRSKRGFGVIGLHSCGDLAAMLLKFYSEQEEARFICIVGCCYMKITCGTKETTSFGYPLSKYVSTSKNHELSYSALDVACHAIENHCDKLSRGDYEDLMVHAYRATLETILLRKDNGGNLKRAHLKNVKVKGNMTFERYCVAAVANLKPEDRPDSADFRTDEVAKYLSHWHQVIAFGTLRFMLAPLVETAILLDRYLYLSEEKLSPSLQAIFDPMISPRNIVLTSYK